MTHVRAALAATITALLIVAGGAAAVLTSQGPTTLAFMAAGQAPAPVASALPAVAATPVPGPNALPLSAPKQLDAAMLSLGYPPVPPGASVYAVKIGRDAAGLTYDDYQAGGGALASNFWPASSIKVLAAVGALEFVGAQGFTGAATVRFGSSAPRTIRSIYDAAIRDSSNDDYDLLVTLAGVDWLNTQFLTPARGFPATVIQKSYTVAGNVSSASLITLAEGGRTATIPPRSSSTFAECPPANCSNLFEMSESVRRVVLHNELPEAERFHITRSDAAAITDALLGADGWIAPAAVRVLGPSAKVYSKPGWVSERDCLDVTLIEARGQRYLLSATVPEASGGCPALITLATAALRVIARG